MCVYLCCARCKGYFCTHVIVGVCQLHVTLFRSIECSIKLHTVKPVLSGHLIMDKIKVLMDNGSLMEVERTSDSLSERLPIKMNRDQFQRK